MSWRDDAMTGDTVSIRFGGVLRHYGVVTSRGTVISNSGHHGEVIEQSMGEFAAGRPVRVHRKGTSLPGHHVERLARRRMGSPYDLTGSNCIDHVRHVSRQRPTPWAVGRASLMAFGDMMAGTGKRRY